MSILLHSSTACRFILGLALALWLFSAAFSGNATADDATPEHARLEAVLRQLDTIERLIAEANTHPHAEHSRYYFDYTRLSADLERVRTGIRDYLAPSRAQPRDLSTLLGDYRQPTSPPVLAPEDTP